MDLTVGMATYDDPDGVYFTVQALRLYQDLPVNSEILVIDNHNDFAIQRWARESGACHVIQADRIKGTAYPRQHIFDSAHGSIVLVLDCHVLLAPGSVNRLLEFARGQPESLDLWQGPLLQDSLQGVATHWKPVWQDQMWGVWACDPRGQDPNAPPFEIGMQGLGCFACRKNAWPGFHPGFRGFGGEEGYLHRKFQLQGGKTLCLPWLRWLHRFMTGAPARYHATLEDRVTNYLLGHMEVGLPLEPIYEHFRTSLSDTVLLRLVSRAEALLEQHRTE